MDKLPFTYFLSREGSMLPDFSRATMCKDQLPVSSRHENSNKHYFNEKDDGFFGMIKKFIFGFNQN